MTPRYSPSILQDSALKLSPSHVLLIPPPGLEVPQILRISTNLMADHRRGGGRRGVQNYSKI